MRKKKHAEHVNHERWLVSYADFITLLFAFFVVMFAVSQVDTKKMGRFTESFSQAVGLITTPSGMGLLPADDSGTSMAKSANKLKRPGEEDDEATKKARDQRLEKLEDSLRELARREKELVGLKVVRRGNELVLRLDATVLFRSGDDRLDDDARRVLSRIAAELKPEAVRIRVEGHTDDVPISTARFPSNWDLSTARATSVVRELSTAQIPPARLGAMGYAEYQPVAPNDTDEHRLQNRRVDFVLTLE